MVRKIFYSILLLTVYANAQIISFPSEWYFKTGDNPDYKNEKYDDVNWSKIKVPSHWENEGFANYDGYAWYRIHFDADVKSIKDNELYLFVGRVDDVDETYLNGILVGSTGKFPPEPQSAWNEQRGYKISKSLLKEKNILAIRVYDMGAPGGIHSGVIGIFDINSFKQQMNYSPDPKKSFYKLVTSNGLIAAIYDEQNNSIEAIYPHIFQAYDENKQVEPFLKNLKLNTEEKPLSASYRENTHVISIVYKNFIVDFFAPFARLYSQYPSNVKVFYAVVKGKEVAIKNLTFTYDKTYCEVLDYNILINDPEKDDYKIFLFSFNDSLHNNKDMFTAMCSNASSHYSELVSDEVNYIKQVVRNCKIPKQLNNDQKNLIKQSITVLKMSQVSQEEIFSLARGQILASLPPGIWNICWIRDAAYSIMALNKLGLFEEAKNALKFFLDADAGYYKNYIHTDGKDYGIGIDYKISVCRYFGKGKEESDFNEDGPNIELDGFGLFLIAFCDYINQSNDEEFFKSNYKIISDKISDAILFNIDENNLIRKDSGPWERHLPGKQYAYTSITAAKGLQMFVSVSKKYNFKNEKYEEGFNKLLRGINEGLVVYGKLIKNNYQTDDPNKYEFYDASTIEAFNFNLFSNKKFFKSHFKEYEDNLRISKERGFYRVNKGDYYDSQEWIVLDLRIASSLIKYNEKKKAKVLIDWITAQSRLNNNLIAELYDVKKSTYEGAVPMVGFGAGAYILTMFDYSNNK